MKVLAWCLFLAAMLTGASHPGPQGRPLYPTLQQDARVLAVLNFGRPQYQVTDFGADPTGTVPSDAAIRNAIAACDPTVGCEIHFSAGTYRLTNPLMTSCGQANVEFCLPNAPITLSGDGPATSILIPESGSNIVVGPTSGVNGLSIHDIGFALPTPMQATSGSDILVPDVNVATLYNLSFSGANNAITLGVNDGSSIAHTTNVYMDALTAQYSNGCFLNLLGGNYYTYVSHAYAQANNTPGSQVLCVPSQVPYGGQPGKSFGVNKFYLSDSNFEGFARGIAIDAYQFSFWDAYFNNLLIDTTGEGPSLELVGIASADSGSSNVSNLHVSNSYFSSSSTACWTYGHVASVHMVAVTCNGAVPDSIPTAGPSCPARTPAPRGETYILFGGTISGAGSISVTLTAPNAEGVPVSVPFSASMQSGDKSVGDVVARLAANINAAPTAYPTCNPFIAANPIGPLLPIRSYSWDPSSDVPTVSVTSSGDLTVIQPAPAGTYTVSPSDAYRIDGHANLPTQISVVTSGFDGAQNGSGVHLFGGTNITIANDRMNSDGASENEYGITIDPSGTYTDVVLNSNDLRGTMSTPFVYSTPLTGVSLTNSGGALTATPLPTPVATPACTTTIVNPFPFPIEAILSGPYNSITKDGRANAWPAGSFANVPLGVGETFEVYCGMNPFPTLTWFAL